MDITGKIKANRTRPAEIEGEEVFVKVYSFNLFMKTCETFQGSDDKAPVLYKEPLVYEAIKVQTRNYKS